MLHHAVLEAWPNREFVTALSDYIIAVNGEEQIHRYRENTLE